MPAGPQAPTGANNNGATTGNLNSGALGTLGTNVLQQDIDTLSTRIQELTTSVNNLVQNIQTNGNSGLGGTATRQQGPSNSNNGFPSMVNPSRLGTQTSGGNGGYGNNVSGMTSGGYSSNRSMYGGNGGFTSGVIATAGAVAGYGVAQSQNLVALNSYATQSLIGYNYNGMSQNQAMQQLYAGVGATPNSQIAIGSGSLTDNIGMYQTLQGRAGSQNVSQTAVGRAALGATYGFGVTNPNLSSSSAATMASGLYSPMLSYNMLRLGYGQTILNRSPGGVNLNAGQSAQAILQGMGLGKATSQQLTAAFATGGKAQNNLNYLTQGTGISTSSLQQYLTGYATLINNDKLSATAATNLISQAANGTPAQIKSARSQLSKLGINTASNDLSSLVQNQASQTGRSGDVASGFNSGLQQSAGLLEDFNNALNSILKGPLGTALGYGGGSLGTIAGSALGSGTNMLGTAGSYMMMNRLAASRAATAAGTAGESELAADAAIGGGSLAAGTGALGALGPLALILGGGIAGSNLMSRVSSALIKQGRVGTTPSNTLPLPNTPGVKSSNPVGKALNKGVTLPSWFTPSAWPGDIWNTITHSATIGGGAGNMATSQQKTGGSNMSGGVSGAAKKAVGAAESQIGVPYAYGDELPGVGLDCSGLIQYAYKQAGISLPRTSQQMWSALSKRSVPTNKVQEGDLVFMAGSDGTANSPGHVGMMINSHQLIQAPYTGKDVQVIAYDPHAWQHAARPSGSGSFIAGSAASSVSSGPSAGNRGMSTGLAGSGGAYGSVNEIDVINAMGGTSSSTSGAGTRTSNGSSGSGNTVTGGSAGGGTTKIPSSASKNAAVAKQIAAKYGWGSGTQWQDFVRVENREAGWNLNAKNPGSDAYGVAQFINGPSEYYQYGGNPNSAQGQFTAMMSYIKQRYGSPAGAWQNEVSKGYYAAGGTTLPGLAIVGERGPELMMQGGGNQVFSNSQTMQLINAIRGSSPAQSPWKTNPTSGGTNSQSSYPPVNINFNSGAISIGSSGSTSQTATQSAREITRQIVKQLSSASIHQAIKSGDKL
jgi:cell wall-associated NlpC family hydrolase